jgi:hypothetical protein
MTGMFDSPAFDPNVEDYANEPPLLEELDINFAHILGKTKAVLHPFKLKKGSDHTDDSAAEAETDALMKDEDITGPIFFLICLGVSLLLQGKVSFGSLYGFG